MYSSRIVASGYVSVTSSPSNVYSESGIHPYHNDPYYGAYGQGSTRQIDSSRIPSGYDLLDAICR